MDISSISAKSKGGIKFGLLLQDEFTSCIWSLFLKHKSDLTMYVWNWLQRTKKQGIKIQVTRCDNGGENKSLQDKIDTTPDFNTHFEHTAPYTPEQNVSIERKFQTFYGKTSYMLNACHLPIHLREQLWAHTAYLASLLDIILVKNHKDKSPYKSWYNKITPWSSNLRSFGEIGIIQDGAIGGKQRFSSYFHWPSSKSF
jgi:hypothetical protein